MFPVECVARGYLAGSGWKDYRATGSVCGIPLPAGLQDGSRLPEPLFTPSTKSDRGTHDENITFDEIAARIGAHDAAELRTLTLAIYNKAAAHAESRGLILADTKFEFGRVNETIILADEVLTPDSSRFWDAAAWKPGGPSRHSTSSSCAIISRPFTGTNRRPLPAFLMTWRRARRPNISKLLKS
jgi:phosphoribosylaminoimidazole-succinocarboxamide synthase